MTDAVDLFAGFGWSEGLRMLGMRDFGIELDAAACATRRANGHATHQGDISAVDPRDYAGLAPGLIASPPCPDLSKMGKRAGRAGSSGRLIDVVPVWVDALRPEWVACEQVVEALPIWREHAYGFRELGYSTWCGVLCAADYGVPQARERAFLLASRARVALPPHPTHAKHAADSFFGELHGWVPASTVLGDVLVDTRCDLRPDGSTQTWEAATRPATTLTTKSLSQWRPSLTPAQALELQSFRPGVTVVGNRTEVGRQIGNAVPPLLAAHVIASLTGRTFTSGPKEHRR